MNWGRFEGLFLLLALINFAYSDEYLAPFAL